MSKFSVEERERLVELCRRTPKRSQTLEMCEAAVETHGTAIRAVPKRLMSKDLCLKAIANNPGAFLELTGDYVCKETLIATYKSAKNVNKPVEFSDYVERKIRLMKKINLEMLMDEEVAKAMVSFYGGLIERKELTVFKDNLEIVDLALDTYGNAIQYIPFKFQTREHILKAIKNKADAKYIHNWFLKNSKFVDEEFLYKVVCEGEDVLERHLIKHQSQRIVDELWKREDCDKYLKHIKREFMTDLVIAKSLETDIENIHHIPDTRLNEECVYLYVSLGGGIGNRKVNKIQSKRIVEKAFQNDKDQFAFFKDEFKTKEMSEEAFKSNKLLLPFIPEEMQTKEMWLDAIKTTSDADKYFMEAITEEFCTEEFLIEAIKRDWELLKKAPKSCLTVELQMKLLEIEPKTIKYFDI